MSVIYHAFAAFYLGARMELYDNYLRGASGVKMPRTAVLARTLPRLSSIPSYQEARMQMTADVTPMTADVKQITGAILARERAAIDRWNRGDVEGTLELYADDVTYFDPITEKRLDGLTSVAEYFRAFFAGKVDIPRYEILNPHVITDGNLAVLCYNLANYIRAADGSETAGTAWNSTQVYRRTGDEWRVVHVHWSFTKHPAAIQGLMT
jgi:uncharacterized protein (TIGR02246 family)